MAAAVGGMMTVVMGGRSPDTYARAFDLGVAMQLTNIARDVGEDARMGRIYLPADWLLQEGVDRDRFLAAPEFSPGLGRVIARVLHTADRLYARADAGVSRLPRSCRPAIRAARLIYCDIGHQLRRRGLDSISRRTVVSRGRKLALVLTASLELVRPPRPPNRDPPLPECQFLLDAVLPLCGGGRGDAAAGLGSGPGPDDHPGPAWADCALASPV